MSNNLLILTTTNLGAHHAKCASDSGEARLGPLYTTVIILPCAKVEEAAVVGKVTYIFMPPSMMRLPLSGTSSAE